MKDSSFGMEIVCGVTTAWKWQITNGERVQEEEKTIFASYEIWENVLYDSMWNCLPLSLSCRSFFLLPRFQFSHCNRNSIARMNLLNLSHTHFTQTQPYFIRHIWKICWKATSELLQFYFLRSFLADSIHGTHQLDNSVCQCIWYKAIVCSI